MTNLILCGGSGTRLWPVSRTLMPKQFVRLFDGHSLFQQTLERNRPLCEHAYIVSNAEQYFLAVDQLEELGEAGSFARFLLEPVGRNTAPAIALACLDIDPDELVLVTPSDHRIRDREAYAQAVKRAEELAGRDRLVTFGIRPDYPETGFGYIEARGSEVLSFKEKPSLETAEEYLKRNEEAAGEETAPRYYWNSGMFCFRAGLFLEELGRHAPEILNACEAAMTQARRSDEGRLLRLPYEAMEAIPSESVDIAVMERSERVAMVPAGFGWSDLGSFDALYEELPKDSAGNTLTPDLIALNARDNLVISEERTVVLLDVENLMVVDTGDALLIGKRGSSQKIREVVAALEASGSELPRVHRTAHRPWGTYTVLEDSAGYKIKRIVVKPGRRLSLQKHYHRSEHWIVLSGTATVTVGDRQYLVRPNESTYIKMGEIHRLENRGKIPVVLIEAQVGEYTGEDDIVRFDDDFERE